MNPWPGTSRIIPPERPPFPNYLAIFNQGNQGYRNSKRSSPPKCDSPFDIVERKKGEEQVFTRLLTYLLTYYEGRSSSRLTLIPEILMAPSSRSNFNKLAAAAIAATPLSLLRRLLEELIFATSDFIPFPSKICKGGTVVFKREPSTSMKA